MTESPRDNQPNSRHRWRRLLLWGGAGLGVGAIAVSIAATWFVRNRLVPIISSVLENTAQRPIEVGPLERITPTSIRFGRSVVPPIEADSSTASAEAVQVDFSIIALFKPRIRFDLTLIEPDVYLGEDGPGQWFKLDLKEGGEAPVDIEFRKVRIKDADIDVQPYSPTGTAELISLNLEQVNLNISENNQRLQGNLNGEFDKGGEFALRAKGSIADQELQASLKADEIQLPQLSGLFIKTEELALDQGFADADLSVALDGLQDDFKLVGVDGTAELDQVQVDLEAIKQPIRPVNGRFIFDGTAIKIQRLSTGLAEVGVEVAGAVETNSNLDLEKTKFDLTTNLQPVQLATLLETVETELGEPLPIPVPIAGEAEAEINLSGDLQNPQVTGVVNNTQPIRVDRLIFEDISTEFAAAAKLDEEFNFTEDPTIVVESVNVEPVTGGEVTAQGEIKLNGLQALIDAQNPTPAPTQNRVPAGQPLPDISTLQPQPTEEETELNPAVDFELEVDTLEVDRIAQLYGIPDTFRLGTLSANANLSGTLEEPKAEAEFAMPNASYPLAGTASLEGRDAEAQVQIADGVANLSVSEDQGDLNVTLDAVQLALTPLINLGLPLSGLPPEQVEKIASVDVSDGRLNAQANVSASLDNLSPNAINGTGAAQINLGNDQITGDATINQGDLQASFNTDPLALDRLVAAGLPFANLSPEATDQIQSLDVRNGSVQARGQISGNLANLSPAGFDADVETQVNLGNTGGAVNANVNLNQGEFQAEFDTETLPLDSLIALGLPYANLPPDLTADVQNLDLRNSQLQSQGFVTGNLANPTSVDGRLQADLNLGNLGGNVKAQGTLTQGQFDANVATTALPLEPLVDLGLPFANLPPDLEAEVQAINLRNGTLQGEATASGSLANLTPEGITANADGLVNLGDRGGLVKADGQLTGGQWTAQLTGDDIALARFSDLVESQTQDVLDPLRKQGLLAQAESMPLLSGLLNTRLNARGPNLAFNPETIRAAGELRLTQLPILQHPFESVFNWTGRRLEIQKAETPQFGADGYLAVEFQGQGVPELSNLDLNLRVSDFDLQSPLVQQVLATLPNDVAQQAPVTGVVNFDGKLQGSLSTLALAGDLRLDSFGVRDLVFDPVMAGTVNAGLNQGVNLALAGESDRIELVLNDQYLPESFLLQQDETLAKGTTVGEKLLVTVREFPLDVLNVAPLEQFNIGEVDGRAFADLEISQLATLDINQIDVVGDFEVRQPRAGYIVINQLSGNISYVDGVANLDSSLTLPNSECIDPAGNVEASCSEAEQAGTLFAVTGRADVIQLLDEFQTEGFNFADLEPGTTPPADAAPQPLEIAIDIREGELQDILTALQWFEVSDVSRGVSAPAYGTAADLKLDPVGLSCEDIANQRLARCQEPNQEEPTLLEQLRRLAEVQAIIALENQQEESQTNPLPPLEALRGGFEGMITAQGSIRSGFTGLANIENTNQWVWDSYRVDDFDLEAVLEENVIRVLPLQITTNTDNGETLYDFRGQLDLASQKPSGQFRIKNLRLEDLQELAEGFVEVPNLEAAGQLNFQATIAGTLENPQATGGFNVIDGTVNGEPLQEAQGSFNYNNALLRFGGDVLVTDTDPARFRGKVPYKLPFAKVAPPDNRLIVQLDIQDEGLKIVNLVSPQLNLAEGKGLVELKIDGILQQNDSGGFEQISLTPAGVFRIQGGKLILRQCELPDESNGSEGEVSCTFEEAITNLSGEARFIVDQKNGNQIDNSNPLNIDGRIRIVENFTAELQGQLGTGKIVVAGVLPVSQPLDDTDPDFGNVLRILLGEEVQEQETQEQEAIQGLNLTLANLYDGNVVGEIRVDGTAFKPRIGGKVVVSKGTVTLPLGAAGGGAGGGGLPNTGPIEPTLENLLLSLGEDVRLEAATTAGFFDAPLLDFGATGSITVNGQLDSLESIRPQGVVNLTRGAVNLYTTRLRLDRGYDQKAIFLPEQGLDPVLDVRLFTRVPESSSGVQPPATAFSAEQAEFANPNTFGTVRTIRVTALVQGPASRINDIIQLRSSPPRSETQLVALLGGGAIEGITGDSTLFIANIASAGLFGQLQQKVVEATGLTEFRLYPARISESSSSGASALGIGLEIGFDITKDMSVSLGRVLAADQPTQLGINYRVSDELLLRGATNFGNESEIRFEYEIQF
ncbi:MAG: translocation/assembly module TamB domain-containing protein [Microcoleaceae cyanobacterium]